MQVRVVDVIFNDIKIVIPEIFQDERGFFMEVYREDQYASLDLPGKFVQDNHSGSTKDVLRGLHFQYEPPMGKLIRVTVGTAFLVAVDIRKGSPSFGKWFGDMFSADNRKMLWAPAGFARGFLSISDYAEIQYKATGIYNKNGEGSIHWDDPDIGVQWPCTAPILSARDRNAQSLVQWKESKESEMLRYDPDNRMI